MLDQNLLGQASTQCDPRPTDPTNQIRTTPYFCDQCVFTKAHFSQPLTRCRSTLQTAYPDFRPCPHITQIKSMPTRRVAGRLHSVNLPLLRLSCKSELFKCLRVSLRNRCGARRMVCRQILTKRTSDRASDKQGPPLPRRTSILARPKASVSYAFRIALLPQTTPPEE